MSLFEKDRPPSVFLRWHDPSFPPPPMTILPPILNHLILCCSLTRGAAVCLPFFRIRLLIGLFVAGGRPAGFVFFPGARSLASRASLRTLVFPLPAAWEGGGGEGARVPWSNVQFASSTTREETELGPEGRQASWGRRTVERHGRGNKGG